MKRATTTLTCTACVVIEPGMHESSLHGNREISGLATLPLGVVRIGKARSHSR